MLSAPFLATTYAISETKFLPLFFRIPWKSHFFIVARVEKAVNWFGKTQQPAHVPFVRKNAMNPHTQAFMEQFKFEGLTFDDISLVTQYADFLPDATSVESRFTSRIRCNTTVFDRPWVGRKSRP